MKSSKPTDYLKAVGIDIFVKGHNSYKLSAKGFMDLTVESWHSGETINVSMCHYGEQNGDLMKDPDVLFTLENDTITYREIQNNYVSMYSENHNEIKDFMENTWVPNLYQQGHKLKEKEMEN